MRSREVMVDGLLRLERRIEQDTARCARLQDADRCAVGQDNGNDRRQTAGQDDGNGRSGDDERLDADGVQARAPALRHEPPMHSRRIEA